MVLDRIKKVNDIKQLNEEELAELQEEIRDFLVENIAKTGGHLASNLGVIELTMALHLSFDLMRDRIIWDVGHQSYTHKILTGRKLGFATLRQYGGMSGFPKTQEDPADAFNTGHSSTSISAGLGMAQARELTGDNYYVVSVIGDGALTGGMAYEAMNNASRMKTNFIIVLNDNQMSISENVGGMNQYLNSFRTSDAYLDLKDGVTNSLNRIPVVGERMVKRIRNAKSGIKQLFVPGMFFENMGITYLGPVDGTNIKEIRKVLAEAKRVRGPVLVHVRTIKGEGYLPAERHPARFHGTGPFDIDTGVPLYHQEKAHYTDVFSTVMRKMGEREPKVVAITAAMADGTGLKRFKNLFPERFFDVGIAEGHAVTFSGGMAKDGLLPFCNIYSSFMQRAYDNVIHDIAIQKLNVVLCLDRAGLVGEDGPTHHGAFDLAYMRPIPNLIVASPYNEHELRCLMYTAQLPDKGPFVIRYPRGRGSLVDWKCPMQEIEIGKGRKLKEGKDIAVITLGPIGVQAEKAITHAEQETGKSIAHYDLRFLKPLDESMLHEIGKRFKQVVTVEDGVLKGGMGSAILEFMADNEYNPQIKRIGLPDQFVQHGSVKELYHICGMDEEGIYKVLISF